MLNYKSSGESKNQIIFIHGNSQSLSFWDDIVKSELVNLYKLICVDLPGHGKSFRSAEPEKDYSLKGMAAHIIEFMKQFEDKPYVLVGLSLGANIIGEAIGKLTNCKGIILLSPSIIGENLSPADILKPNPNVAPYFSPSVSSELLDLLINDVMVSVTDENKKRFIQEYNLTDPNARIQIALSVTNKDYLDELENIKSNKIPTAAIFGKEDRICFTDYIDKINFPLWNSKTILIENAGHMVNFDKPKELVEYIKIISEQFFD